MTTNTTNSQAASIEKDDEFQRLLSANESAATDAHICGGDFGTGRKALDAYNELINYIDAKLAQARREGWIAMESTACNAEARNADEWKARATAAESRLAEIQRGVEEMPRFAHTYGRQEEFKLHPTGSYIRREDVLALLAPQGQASDTSGLPG